MSHALPCTTPTSEDRIGFRQPPRVSWLSTATRTLSLGVLIVVAAVSLSAVTTSLPSTGAPNVAYLCPGGSLVATQHQASVIGGYPGHSDRLPAGQVHIA